MLASFLHWIGFGLCHQLPQRSFFAAGYQVPVCARDTGIYMGLAVGVVVLVLLDRGKRSSELPPVPVLIVMALGLASMVFDGATSYAGLRGTTNDIRLATGIGAGYFIAGIVLPMLHGEVFSRSSNIKALSEPADAVTWLLSGVVLFGVVRWFLPLLGAAYPILVALSIVASFGLVNLLIVSLAPPVSRRAHRVLDLWPSAAVALAMTFMEIALAAALKGWLLSLTTTGR